MESAQSNVVITGGSLSAPADCTAIYWPMEGTLTIGGNATVTGGTAIEAKMGTITIKDQAVITGTGDWNENEPENGGSSPKARPCCCRRSCTVNITVSSSILPT